MKRAVLFFGAGASIDYNAPSTEGITTEIERQMRKESCGVKEAFMTIRDRLFGYLGRPPNFEEIYHCAHELIATFPPQERWSERFRPRLVPFIERTFSVTQQNLFSLCILMVQTIRERFSNCCDSNPLSLKPLTSFIEGITGGYITRIYTTNYDDFILQAAPNLYTGFESSTGPRRFDIDGFWASEEVNSVFYLHGSVHLIFAPPSAGDEYVELSWIDERTEALKYLSWPNDQRRMDGSGFSRTPIITGLEKLSQLQQCPFSYYYTAMARDVMRADVIYVVGSGLSDLHINTWLREARSRNPSPPILFIGLWPNSFLKAVEFDLGGPTERTMFHDLRIHIRDRANSRSFGSGWTLSSDAAIWDKGFQSFLNTGELAGVLRELNVNT